MSRNSFGSPSCYRLILTTFLTGSIVLIQAMTSAPAAQGQTTGASTAGIIEFMSSGKRHTGMALVELAHEMVVLGRDGSLHSLREQEMASVKRQEGSYQPISAIELRSQLRQEYGPTYEVLATQNFLVVQPKDRGDRWPKLFEHSHRSFSNYMSKRGVKVRNGRFPMVAVVFPDQRAMYAEFKRKKIDLSRVSGVYSNDTNRVLTHDGGNLPTIAATVRHEAAHQSAFNSGIHSRVTDTPKWITEGIGQLFEPAAMTKPGTTARERANLDSMAYIKATMSGRNQTQFNQTIVQLIGDDMLFNDQKTISKAYAVSWAMMFYLAERQPKQFAKLLNHTGKRPSFRSYDKKDRIKDFQQIVGVEMFEFSKRVSWFIQKL